MTPDQALAALQISPEPFLGSHPLMIAGQATTGPTDYVIYKELATDQKFKIAQMGINGTAFKAYNVPMRPSTQFPGLANVTGANKIPVPGVSVAVSPQCKIMVTGQLTGCSFLMQKAGGSLICAHIQPQGGMDGSKLHTALMNAAEFQGKPNTPVVVFGRNFYPSGRATIIGVHRMGQWEVYAQLGDAHTVTAVKRIL